MRTAAHLLGLAVLFTTVPAFQQAPPQKEIDEAIRRGAEFLVKKFSKGVPTSGNDFELVVYTLIHAELDPKKVVPLKKGIDDLIKTKVNGTYRTAIRALALHSLLVKIKDVTFYYHLKDKMNDIQREIAEAGQYLVDTQLDNGQWTYSGDSKNKPEVSSLTTGSPAPESKFNPTASKVAWQNASYLTGTLYKLVPKYGADPQNKMTDLGKPVQLGQQKGDNSNTQYGVLGLIAASMSGVEVPRTTWEMVMKYFEAAQWSDGGFGYQEGDGGAPGQSTLARRRGIVRATSGAYGSMTTAGAVALAAAYKYLGKDYKKEARFQAALKWLGDNFSVTENPKRTQAFYLYFMYGLERVGAFAGVKELGTHDWYAEGAAQLLKIQKPDGSWPPRQHEDEAIATSFAVLFLKRATAEIISGSAGIDAK